MSDNPYCEYSIPSVFTRAKELEDQIVEGAEACGYSEEELFALRLSLEEALTNAIRHGNRQDEEKEVNVRYRVTESQIDIYISDEGNGFNPARVPDPTEPENLEAPTGRGIMLMRAYMDRVEYNRRGNEVHMVIKHMKGKD